MKYEPWWTVIYYLGMGSNMCNKKLYKEIKFIYFKASKPLKPYLRQLLDLVKMNSVGGKIVLVIMVITCVGAQTTGNYILESYNAAMELKTLYENEVLFYRSMLTAEAWDMGRVFGDNMATWIGRADNENQGEALRRCAEITAVRCQSNIDLFADRILDLQRDSEELDLSVFRQLMDMNIKSEEYSLFYYHHSLRMEERLEWLNDHHIPMLQEAYIYVFNEWFTLYSNIQICAADALERQ